MLSTDHERERSLQHRTHVAVVMSVYRRGGAGSTMCTPVALVVMLLLVVDIGLDVTDMAI